MPTEVQMKMEQAFQTDFSNVNIHTNSQSATDIGALAYTQGNDIHFASGQYNPHSQSGQELLGHELTHVVQQRAGRVKPTTQMKGFAINDDKGLEKEADDMGRKAASGKWENTVISPKRNTNLKVKQKKGTIQRNPGVAIAAAGLGISAAQLGLAVFQAGNQFLTSGRFSSSSFSPSYMHSGTPISIPWTSHTHILRIYAHHPRIGIGTQRFYFRLSYEKNGYDLRNVLIQGLQHRSSRMMSSVFSVDWGGQAHSLPNDPHAAVAFNIRGNWDPVGSGNVSFSGQLIVDQNRVYFSSFRSGEDWVSRGPITTP